MLRSIPESDLKGHFELRKRGFEDVSTGRRYQKNCSWVFPLHNIFLCLFLHSYKLCRFANINCQRPWHHMFPAPLESPLRKLFLLPENRGSKKAKLK
jgi:hypothetical protein